MKTIKIADGIELTPHLFNLEKSVKVYNTCSSKIKKKACYNNVFHALTATIADFKEKGWKVAYGYISSFENLRIFHCYILDEQNEVVDPTYINLHGKKPEEIPTYYTLETFDFNAYMKKLKECDHDPSFFKYFMMKKNRTVMWGMEQTPRYAFLD
ncbi:hypothetical protein CN918_30440 [Priestia megaterium]|nr:hypothetical protein CN918_30440 [Priestia megaterium]